MLTSRHQIEQRIRDYLDDVGGSAVAGDVVAHCVTAGAADSTVRRTADRMGIVKTRSGNVFRWALPPRFASSRPALPPVPVPSRPGRMVDMDARPASPHRFGYTPAPRDDLAAPPPVTARGPVDHPGPEPEDLEPDDTEPAYDDPVVFGEDLTPAERAALAENPDALDALNDLDEIDNPDDDPVHDDERRAFAIAAGFDVDDNTTPAEVAAMLADTAPATPGAPPRPAARPVNFRDWRAPIRYSNPF